MQKLINFFNDITTRYSFYFVGIQIIFAWIYIITIFSYIGYMYFELILRGYSDILLIILMFLLTIAFTYTIFSLLITTKLFIKEQINPQFRIKNNIVRQPIIKMIITILFIFGGSTWLICIIIGFSEIPINIIHTLLNSLKFFYAPIIVLGIGYFIYKNKNILSKMSFYIIETILFVGLIYIYINFKKITLFSLGLCIPYTILLHWIYKKINKFIEKNN